MSPNELASAEPAHRRLHRGDPGRRGPHAGPHQGFREGVIALPEIREEEADALKALVAEPALLEGDESPIGRGHRGIDVLPVGAGLLDADRELEEPGVDPGRFRRGFRSICRRALGRDAQNRHTHSDLQPQER